MLKQKHLCQTLCHPNPRQGRQSFWQNNWSLFCTKSRLLFLPLPKWNPRNLVCIWDDHYKQGWQWHRLVKTVDWRMLSFFTHSLFSQTLYNCVLDIFLNLLTASLSIYISQLVIHDITVWPPFGPIGSIRRTNLPIRKLFLYLTKIT